MKIALVGFAGILLSGLFTLPQSNPEKVFLDLQTQASTAQTQFNSGENGRLAARVSEATNRLKTRWEQADNRELPQPYLKTLEFDAGLLRRVLTENDRQTQIELLTYVSDDLKVKNDPAQRTLGAAGGVGPTVRVTVRTMKNGQGVSGYLARCNPRRFADLQSAMFVFNNETDPTTLSRLPPGNYEMWIEKPAGAKISSKPVTIGGDGQTSQVITFEVP